jgi:hypothetical protein
MRSLLPLLLLLAGCLKLAPTVIVAPDGATQATSAECLACINAPDSPDHGCSQEVAACSQAPSCERGYQCALQDGCYSGPIADLAVCARHCAEVGGIITAEDPSTVTALHLYQCILGKCNDRCFQGGGAADAAAPPDVAPSPDGGGACTGASDRAVAASPAFASVARDCGLMCIGKNDPTCAARCVEGRGVSAPCSRCWGDAITCGAASCLIDCIDPANTACAACTARSCDPAFHACSGL